MNDSTRGFTLIELVITIAVIAIISAVIIPNFMGTTDKARLKTDIQSARILQNAIDLYEAEQSGSIRSLAIGNAIAALVNAEYLNETPAVQTDKADWVYDDDGKVRLNIDKCDGKILEIARNLSNQDKKMIDGLAPEATPVQGSVG